MKRKSCGEKGAFAFYSQPIREKQTLLMTSSQLVAAIKKSNKILVWLEMSWVTQVLIERRGLKFTT